MKVILSRKGFDSSNGGIASPILPDGTLLSLPIPSRNERTKYADLCLNGKTFYEIIGDLNPRTRIKENYKCHLDPDLHNYSDTKDWQPLFGQEGASETHLVNCNVKENDLFLFFGWYKQTELIDGKFRFVRSFSFPD